MREKPFDQMRGVGKELKDLLVSDNGMVPDNFVESAGGTIEGQPNIHTDPKMRQVLEHLDATISEGHPQVKEDLEKY